MHSKVMGNIGEAAVALYLMKQGYEVFTELGDNSKVDLMILLNNVPIKIQVKCRSEKNGKVEVDSRKAGPNYRFRYTQDDVDVFACYVPERDSIFFISSKELLQNSTTTTFRFEEPKKGNQHGCKLVCDYADIRDALKDYEPRTLHALVNDGCLVDVLTTT